MSESSDSEKKLTYLEWCKTFEDPDRLNIIVFGVGCHTGTYLTLKMWEDDWYREEFIKVFGDKMVRAFNAFKASKEKQAVQEARPAEERARDTDQQGT